ncbi:bifunctional metallophosphatase/5'-nucleotidase [Bacillus timonensis]|uniref:Bifunctional metallophosphatase/5'-nucleotidase n=1 Tax=Bacillus timonensis TaxID=1033734 RepID=A0A4S3PKB0_9BACI|nr:bifunctional UDP-sugar hydrolase/5'-nucleotidase [Bacillus timonensis]THE09887.1 bifunctional metallophosphatase/5'-nucleotidase [Bacillus timonensis]
MIETVHIYHTNDLHSHFDRWPKITKYITEMRQLHQQNNEEMLLIDIGDHIDRFHPISEASYGKTNVKLLNQLQYDYATIGNNEGITMSYEHLDSLYDEAEFKVLLANLFDKNGKLPKWACPYDIYVLPSGFKIGIIGLTVHYIGLYKLLGWNIKDALVVLRETLAELKDQTDMILLLSHLGINEDEQIARDFPEVDVLLGGHTHHLLENGKRINNTLLCCAQKYGNYIGHVTLHIDSEQKKLIESTANVIATKSLPESKETNDILSHYLLESIQMLKDDVIAVIDEPLISDWFAETSFSKLLAEVLREWCDGDLSMVNAGLLLDSLPAGKVTREDLHRICPHPINPCKVWVMGDELKEIILQANTKEMESLRIKGLGFRGKVMGKMVYDGVELETTKLSDGVDHITTIKINGEELEPDKLYSVATIDMYTFGLLFPVIRDAKDKKYYMPEFLRDLLAEKIKTIGKGS